MTQQSLIFSTFNWRHSPLFKDDDDDDDDDHDDDDDNDDDDGSTIMKLALLTAKNWNSYQPTVSTWTNITANKRET